MPARSVLFASEMVVVHDQARNRLCWDLFVQCSVLSRHSACLRLHPPLLNCSNVPFSRTIRSTAKSCTTNADVEISSSVPNADIAYETLTMAAYVSRKFGTATSTLPRRGTGVIPEILVSRSGFLLTFEIAH